MAYAEKTTVSVESSQAEIQKMLRKSGATQFLSGFDTEEWIAVIGFTLSDRQVRIRMGVTNPEDHRMVRARAGARNPERPRSKKDMENAHTKEVKRRWRALALIIKAKIEAVESGITTVEEEFLAHIVCPDGTTVGENAIPSLQVAYATGRMPKLLPPGLRQ